MRLLRKLDIVMHYSDAKARLGVAKHKLQTAQTEHAKGIHRTVVNELTGMVEAYKTVLQINE